jgi:hypothetical protein
LFLILFPMNFFYLTNLIFILLIIFFILFKIVLKFFLISSFFNFFFLLNFFLIFYCVFTLKFFLLWIFFSISSFDIKFIMCWPSWLRSCLELNGLRIWDINSDFLGFFSFLICIFSVSSSSICFHFLQNFLVVLKITQVA